MLKSIMLKLLVKSKRKKPLKTSVSWQVLISIWYNLDDDAIASGHGAYLLEQKGMLMILLLN